VKKIHLLIDDIKQVGIFKITDSNASRQGYQASVSMPIKEAHKKIYDFGLRLQKAYRKDYHDHLHKK